MSRVVRNLRKGLPFKVEYTSLAGVSLTQAAFCNILYQPKVAVLEKAN